MDMRGLKILVTGGAGFIGSHLVDALVQENSVTILDNFSSGRKENIAHLGGNDDVRVITGDIRDKSAVDEAAKGIDVVFHLAVQCLRASLLDPETNHEVNATGTLNLCQAALQHSIRRFVYVSSSEVYGTAKVVPMDEMHPREPTTVYGASKLAGEKYALAYHKTYGLPSMAVIPFNTYGPREHLEGPHGEVIPKFTLRVLNGKPPIIFGDGSQTRDFTYVGDTVRGILMAAESDAMIGETVNIARGEEVSVRNLARKICALLGRGDLQPVFEESRQGDVTRHFADVRKAERLLRFRAETSLDAGLKQYLSWFNGQGYDLERLASEDIIFNWKDRG